MSQEIISSFHLAYRSAALIVTPGVYGNHSVTQQGQQFEEGAQTAYAFENIPALIRAAKVVGGFIPASVLGIKKDLPFDNYIVSDIQKISYLISEHAGCRYEHAEDFLYILSTVDDIDLMRKIAYATQISELDDEEMLCNPRKILSIPHIRDCAYLADSVSGLIRAFDLLGFGLQNDFDVKPTAASLSKVMDLIGGALGLASAFGAPRNAGSAGMMLGLNLSRMLLGKEIPIGVQSNNPMLRAPSIVGKMMFGESRNGTHCFDTNQHFAKPIAVFGDMTGGAGTSSFMMKLAPSLNSAQSVSSLMAGSISGFSSASGTFSTSMMKGMQEQVCSALGCKATDTIEGKYADHAIPFQAALSNSFATLNKELPKLTMEMRDKLESVTADTDKIDTAVSKMVNSEQASKLGLDSLSQQAAKKKQEEGEAAAKPYEDQIVAAMQASSPKLQNVIPPQVFQAGWNQMSSARQALGGANKMFAQAEFLTKTLG